MTKELFILLFFNFVTFLLFSQKNPIDTLGDTTVSIHNDSLNPIVSVPISDEKLAILALGKAVLETDEIWRSRYENGTIGIEGKKIKVRKFLFFKKLVKHGEWKYYNINGKLIQINIWEYGRLVEMISIK